MPMEFTESAKTLIAWAKDEALRAKQEHIGTEYLLLGMLLGNSDGIACRVLNQLHVNVEKVRHEIERLDERNQIPLSEQIANEVDPVKADLLRRFAETRAKLDEWRKRSPWPFSPDAMVIGPRARIRAESAAHDLGHTAIAPEHMLLGFARDNYMVATQILMNLKADLKEIDRLVLSEIRRTDVP